jgi:hypothetical protein
MQSSILLKYALREGDHGDGSQGPLLVKKLGMQVLLRRKKYDANEFKGHDYLT